MEDKRKEQIQDLFILDKMSDGRYTEPATEEDLEFMRKEIQKIKEAKKKDVN